MLDQKIINVEVAEILGAFIGDGWIESSENGLYICGHKIDDKAYYDAHIGPLFSKNFTNITPKEFPYWQVYGLSCYKKNIIKQALELEFFKGKKCYTVVIPEYIMDSDNIELKKSVLRGIFDTDGSFWCERSNAKISIEWKRTHKYIPKLGITSCSNKLLEQCCEILKQFGIKFRLKHKNKAGRLCNRNVHDSYLLLIDSLSEVHKFFNIIMPKNPKHQSKYALWKKNGFLQ